MANTFTNLLYHIVFSTKNRDPVINDDIREDLYSYIGGIIRRDNGILLEIGGIEDHVHLVTKFRQDVAVAEFVKTIKAKSSKWVNESGRMAQRFAWQVGYGAFTVSASQLERVRAYVRTQREHHRKVEFREELIAMLERNGIQYDERYFLG